MYWFLVPAKQRDWERAQGDSEGVQSQSEEEKVGPKMSGCLKSRKSLIQKASSHFGPFWMYGLQGSFGMIQASSLIDG